MRSLKFAIVFLVATALAVSAMAAGTVRSTVGSAPTVLYAAHQVEAYLSTEQAMYVRPGFKITLVKFEIPADRRPIAEVKFTDDADQPLDRLGKVTPGVISASFILGWYDAAHRDYVSYTTRVQKSPITNVEATQASADSGGTWEDIALGHAKYRFKTVLPENFNKTKTHTLGIYGSRNLVEILGKSYYANVLSDFRPDGGQVSEKWDAFKTATCNNCHDPLALHGGSRQEVKLCVLCHNRTQSLDPDTGNTVEMRLMIHKIHDGPNLANGYTIIGFGQSANDYSDVTYPQDLRNCTTCHKADVAEGHIWYSNPSRIACGSCHDSINWVTGAGHIAGPQADDSDCTSCHLPEGETEFDASVKGAHTVPTKSTQLPGLALQITNVTDTAPGQKPTVTFKLKNTAGDVVNPNNLNRFRFLVGGPTTDYAEYFREDGKPATCQGDGTCTYTFKTLTIPAAATGTWTISADYYNTVTIDNHTDTGLAVRDAGQNPIYNFIVTDAQTAARRQVVSTAKCNKCHDVLALHGGQRYKVEECVICHNPNETAEVEGQELHTSIQLKWMAHKIHTGEELSRDYVIGDVSFKEVLYPGDRRNCQACHNAGTYDVPLPEGALPTQTPDDFVAEWAPASASCLSCHDSVDASAHAYVNNAPFGEACASCHGPDREFSVAKAHAR